MTAKQLFSKTTPFIMAKLALGLATVLVSAVLFAILMGLGWLFGEGGMVFMFAVWIGAIGGIRFVIMHYFGYLVKAGHVAVLAEICRTGVVPTNQVDYGKKMVTERFVTSNAFFAIDKLISAAVKEIQAKLGKLGNALDFIPGMNYVTGLAQFFVDISLNYVDECCLGWTFWKKDEQGPFQSATDAVVIYAQNWKALLGGAAKTMVKVIIGTVIVGLLAFVPIGVLFKILKWSPLAAFIIACLIAWTFKFAILDSYIMIEMMAVYMNVAPTTQIKFDLYGQFSTFSAKFKELWNRGQAEAPPAGATGTKYTSAPAGTTPYTPAQPTASTSTPARPITPANPVAPAQPAASTASAKPVFCGQCGAKNDPGTKFCGSCGAKM